MTLQTLKSLNLELLIVLYNSPSKEISSEEERLARQAQHR